MKSDSKACRKTLTNSPPDLHPSLCPPTEIRVRDVAHGMMDTAAPTVRIIQAMKFKVK